MRRIRLVLFLCILFCLLGINAFAQSQEEPTHQVIPYGKSELGQTLECHILGSEDANQSLLIIFGVHGFEDAFDHDGEILRMIGENVIAHYAASPQTLKDFRLYIIPTANPDGLYKGTSKDGFGRCNANGLDINRDFPIGWKPRTGARNKTAAAPFSTAEARAIRDLVEQISPTYAIDVHGWINAAYGTGEMARVFARAFGFDVKRPQSGGMLCLWLSTLTEEAIMIEMPYAPDKEQYVLTQSANLITGVDAWISLKSDSDNE